jgi:hypothetical protein
MENGMALGAELPTARLRSAMLARDLAAVLDTFASDARLHSPLTDRLEFHGHEQLCLLIPVLFDVLQDLTYTAELADGSTAFLVARATVGGLDLELVDHIRYRPDGKIADFTTFFRPLPAAAVALQLIGAGLGRHRGPAYGGLVSNLARPLATIAKIGDRVGARLIRTAVETAP